MKKNTTRLPDDLKSGIGSLSGQSMDGVKVHYNSAVPKQIESDAYSQGTDIHIDPDQKKHLPQEVWNVIQQKKGRIKPTLPAKVKVDINDDRKLENDADIVGSKALQMKSDFNKSS